MTPHPRQIALRVSMLPLEWRKQCKHPQGPTESTESCGAQRVSDAGHHMLLYLLRAVWVSMLLLQLPRYQCNYPAQHVLLYHRICCPNLHRDVNCPAAEHV